MSWTIKGEAGATLDATVRTLESLNINFAGLTLTSLDSDVFEWSAAASDAAGTGTIVPDPGQVVEVFYAGTRRFRGHVTIPRVRTGSVEVTVEGPWWWWQRIQLTQLQADDESNTSERPSYVFPTQSLKTSIEALIDRAIANGVPIIRGSVAAMFDFPRITLSEKSCAQALAELMSICPDAVAYYDYSAASGTNPTLNIARRGSMPSSTLTVGTDTVEEIDLQPRLDLEVAQVKIGSMTRNATTGANQWATQTSGTATPGKNQLIVVSGPEVNDFLPKDASNTVQVKSFAMPTGGVSLSTLTNTSPHRTASITGDARTFVLANDERIATLIRAHGAAFQNYAYLSNGGRYLVSNYTTGNLTGALGINLDRPELVSRDDTSGLYVIMSGGIIPDWLKEENGYTIVNATLTGWIRYTRNDQTTEPAIWDSAKGFADYSLVGYEANVTSTAGYYQYNLFYSVSIPCKLISANLSTLTTIYRAWAYDYINPPAGLAAALLGAQNWVPYEGRILTVGDAVDGAQDLLKKWNVAGTIAAHASMGALPKSIQYDITRGRKIINLGSPARVDFGTLAARFKRHPKDNIIYL